MEQKPKYFASFFKKERMNYNGKPNRYNYNGKWRCNQSRIISTDFHRVIKGFMIQGGCPLGNGTGNPGYSIKGEFSNNGFTNQLKHEAGVLSMARSMMPNSAGSQFFIMHKAAPHLDGEYAAFGKVIEGMDVVDKIASVKTFMDSPYEKQVMASVTVDTQGEEYPEPEKIEK